MRKKRYTISRKKAGEMLKTSTRTVDRYIKSGKLSAIRDDRKIRLNEKEINIIIKRKKDGKKAGRKGNTELVKKSGVDKNKVSTRQMSRQIKEEADIRENKQGKSQKEIKEEESEHKKIFLKQVAELQLKQKKYLSAKMEEFDGIKFEQKESPATNNYDKNMQKSVYIDCPLDTKTPADLSTDLSTAQGGKGAFVNEKSAQGERKNMQKSVYVNCPLDTKTPADLSTDLSTAQGEKGAFVNEKSAQGEHENMQKSVYVNCPLDNEMSTEKYIGYLYYKIGSMESQLKNSISLYRYFEEWNEKNELQKKLKKKLRINEKKLKILLKLLYLCTAIIVTMTALLFKNYFS